MIYNSLDTIPYKLFVDIESTQEYWKLSQNAKMAGDLNPARLKMCEETWEKLYEEHLSYNRSSESKKIFKLSKNIDYLTCMSNVIITGCSCLRFEYNEKIHSIFTANGFKLSIEDTDDYYKSIDAIEREANDYIVKAEFYKKMLPEIDEDEVKKKQQEFTIDDVLASYGAILGFDIGDFNTISYMKYFAYQKQVNAKIESIKKQNPNQNGRKKRSHN
jgi:hypothetical protein